MRLGGSLALPILAGLEFFHSFRLARVACCNRHRVTDSEWVYGGPLYVGCDAEFDAVARKV